MSRELIAKQVDDHVYEFQQFQTTTALSVLAKLTKLVGEPLAIALGSVLQAPKQSAELVNGVPSPVGEPKSSFLDRDISSDAIGKAVKALTERLDETEVIGLVRKLTTEGVLCDHKPVIFEEHFRGRMLHLFKVVKAALEAQYGNFSDAVTAQFGRPAAGGQGIRLG